MKKYQTVSFKDNSQGRNQAEEAIKNMTNAGWQLMNRQNASQGYGTLKTIALGAIFLPAALLGRKNNKIELTFEKEVSADESTDSFMEKKQTVATLVDGSVECPSCQTKITKYTAKQFLFSKAKVYKCPQCGHEILK